MSQGFFCAQPLPAPGQTPLCASLPPLPHGEERRRARTFHELLCQPPLPHPRGISPSCLSPPPLSSAGHKAPSPDRGDLSPCPHCYPWCLSKSFGLYIYFCWIVCTFPGVLFLFFFFFWLSDTCKVFFFIYVKIKYGLKAECWSLFSQAEGWEGNSIIPWRIQQDPFLPLWQLKIHSLLSMLINL